MSVDNKIISASSASKAYKVDTMIVEVDDSGGWVKTVRRQAVEYKISNDRLIYTSAGTGHSITFQFELGSGVALRPPNFNETV